MVRPLSTFARPASFGGLSCENFLDNIEKANPPFSNEREAEHIEDEFDLEAWLADLLVNLYMTQQTKNGRNG